MVKQYGCIENTLGNHFIAVEQVANAEGAAVLSRYLRPCVVTLSIVSVFRVTDIVTGRTRRFSILSMCPGRH